jgi:hypothetical protein
VRYKGEIVNGRPVLAEQVALPENAKIMIMVESSLSEQTRALTLEQRTAAQGFLEAARNIRERGLTDEDRAALASLDGGRYRSKFGRVLEV